MALAGDIMPIADIHRQPRHVYAGIAPLLLGADFSFANLEAPVRGDGAAPTTRRYQPPVLTFSHDEFDFLTGFGAARLSAVSTNNNHSLDLGLDGLARTLATADRVATVPVGTRPPGDGRPHFAVFDRGSMRLGLVCFTFGLNGRRRQGRRRHCLDTAPLNRPHAEADLAPVHEQLAACRDAGADFVILSLHWGMEYEFFLTRHQVAIAHELAEGGRT